MTESVKPSQPKARDGTIWHIKYYLKSGGIIDSAVWGPVDDLVADVATKWRWPQALTLEECEEQGLNPFPAWMPLFILREECCAIVARQIK